MAQSVTLVSESSNRFLRIAGTLVASAWANGAVIYTVPAGKRLVVKTNIQISWQGTPAAPHFLFNNVQTQPYELSYVLSAGVRIVEQNSGGSGYFTGFLEDDI
jgi:hypothetical protein